MPLAKRCVDAPELVDVYELIITARNVAGILELNDRAEQRSRFDAQNIGCGEQEVKWTASPRTSLLARVAMPPQAD